MRGVYITILPVSPWAAEFYETRHTRSSHRRNHVCQIFSQSVQGLQSSDTPKLPFLIDLLRCPYNSSHCRATLWQADSNSFATCLWTIEIKKYCVRGGHKPARWPSLCANRHTDRHTPMTTRPCGLRRAGKEHNYTSVTDWVWLTVQSTAQHINARLALLRARREVLCALSHGGQFGLGILFEVFSVLVNIENSDLM